jgi:hypothetical protein
VFEFERLLEFVRVERNFDFTGYKRSSLTRRTEKRMHELGIEGYTNHLDYLQARRTVWPSSAGRARFSRSALTTATHPRTTTRCRSGGATSTCPGVDQEAGGRGANLTPSG